MDSFNHSCHIPHTNILESWPRYALANPETYDLLVLPHGGELRYSIQRESEEILHRDWMRQRGDLEKKCQEMLEEYIKVQSANNRVKFMYEYKGHEVLGATIFVFKIVLIYRHLLRKWYLSPGYSFVPEAIDLKGKLKSGTYNPFSKEVLDVIIDVRRLIDIFMIRLTTVYQFVHDVQRRYKDVEFSMNAICTTMKLTFTDNAWPSNLQRSNIRDTIVVELKLNKNIQVHNVEYKCIQRTDRAKDRKDNLNKLESKLQNFFYFPLEEAVERFITGEEESMSLQEQENSDGL